VQHFIYHLAPTGLAGFVLANGSMSSNQSGEGEIRKAIIEADLVDCMVTLPGQLFYSTQIPVCLWFICRDKRGKPSPGLRPPSPSGRGARGEGYRDRRGSVLFIDARKMGTLVDRVHRELTDDDLAKIAGTYHLWRGDPHPASSHSLPGGEWHYRGGFKFSGLVEAARKFRNKQTPAETIMWELLRDRRCANLKFRRQHQIGDYIADFFCNDHKLVIELDGKGHREPRQAQKDKTRDAYFQSLGLTVIRLRNEEFLSDPEAALNKIIAQLPVPIGRGAGGEGVAVYRDMPGFCRSATLDDIRKHGHVLTPGRFVGAEEAEDDGEPFKEKMQRLTATLRQQQAEAAKLDVAIAANLKELGYGS
jgi:type I restriction-modification system DNA methylase subunit